MARQRRQLESLEFGSDSFLDIVANIVGILIILIVIAGVRMSQAPPPIAQSEPEISETNVAEQLVVATPTVQEAEPVQPVQSTMVESTEVDLIEMNRKAAEKAAQLAAEELARYRQEPEVTFSTTLGPVATFIEPLDSEVTRQMTLLQDDLQREQQRITASQQKLQELTRAQAALTEKLQTARSLRTQLVAQQKTVDQAATALMTQQAQLMRQKANLNEQLVLVQRESKPAATIQHAMVPMSKQVAGHEWHFEVRGGKVSFIPLDELMAQVQTKVERWAEWIAKYDTHEGIVGPVEGFSLEYKVSRERKSLVEELSNGPGMFRVGLDRWELIPAGQGYAENLQQATHPQSMFRSTLNRCSLDDTITLWVYPDSFEMYQELSKIAHQMGYRVAARPLPADKKIGGSPHGSKSVSQ